MKVFNKRIIENIYNTFIIVISSYIFWLLLLCFTFRNYFDKYIGYISYNTDSATYWLAAQNLHKGLIDVYRTPLYPLILKLMEGFGTESIFENTIIFQQVISFISIIPFYFLTKKIFRNKQISFLASLVYGCHHSVLQIIYGIYAESLLISLLVFFLYYFYSFISKPSTSKWVFINIFIFVLVMLKPLCIILYAIMLVIGVTMFVIDPIIKEKSLSLSNIILGYFIGFMLLIGFCTINKIQNNYFGLSTVSHDNNFANVILSNAYQDIPDKKLVAIIDTAKYYGHYFTIYYLNNDFEKYQKSFAAFPPQYKFSESMLGVKSIPSNNMGYNRQKIAPLIRKAMFSKIHFNYILSDLFSFSNSIMFSIKSYLIYLLFFIESLFILFRFIFKRKIDWMKVIVLSTGMSILFASLLGGINDVTRERVLLPVLPFLIILFFDLINYSSFATIHYIRKMKGKNGSL